MKKVMMLLAGLVFAVQPAFAEQESKKEVWMTPGVLSVEVKHKGQPVKIMRNQNRKNRISEFYQPTYRGKIQPMHPFEPNAVETIGELDLIDYLVEMSNGDDSIIVIDSRTPDWVKRGTIPGAVNIPFTEFSETARTAEIMEEQFNVQAGETWDFSYAKTLVMFCNGVWCGQSPAAIKKLLSMGYPAARIKYFRGGMQSWQGLGLTVVDP